MFLLLTASFCLLPIAMSGASSKAKILRDGGSSYMWPLRLKDFSSDSEDDAATIADDNDGSDTEADDGESPPPLVSHKPPRAYDTASRQDLIDFHNWLDEQPRGYGGMAEEDFYDWWLDMRRDAKKKMDSDMPPSKRAKGCSVCECGHTGKDYVFTCGDTCPGAGCTLRQHIEPGSMGVTGENCGSCGH